MSGLGRVNLLVGTNNCGKTSVLEAIHLLSTPGSASPLWLAQRLRGEYIETTTGVQIDIASLVHGHMLTKGREFRITGQGTLGTQELKASLVRADLDRRDVDEDDGDNLGGPEQAATRRLVLHLRWVENEPIMELRLPLTRGRLRGREYRPQIIAAGAIESPQRGTVSYITTEGLPRDRVIAMFERVVLTPEEVIATDALRTIEPTIERIASIGTYQNQSSREGRGGLAIMVAGQRVPIGSMGDGIWRMLGIVLALVNARGSALLVDEIDTGLHYSVLVDMWRLVLETARNLDVQVFATTHSRDCYEALAAVAEPGRTEISLQRIERGKLEAVAFSELEIRQAAERGLEVR